MWANRVHEWLASGQTAKEFAQGREFKASTLTWWRRHLRRLAAGSGPEAPVRMAEVHVVRQPTPSTVTVRVGAARIEVQAGFDTTLLRAVVDALGEAR